MILFVDGVFPYTILSKNTADIYNERKLWCEKILGKETQFVIWYCVANVSIEWHFKNEEDAVLFKLTWG